MREGVEWGEGGLGCLGTGSAEVTGKKRERGCREFRRVWRWCWQERYLDSHGVHHRGVGVLSYPFVFKQEESNVDLHCR